MTRYSVTLTPDHRKYVIKDHALDAFCTLPDDGDPSTLLPLEWDSYAAAMAWLERCKRLWSRGLVPAPKGWNEKPQGPTVCPNCTRPVDNVIEFHIPGASGPGHTKQGCPHCIKDLRESVLAPMRDVYTRVMLRRQGKLN